MGCGGGTGSDREKRSTMGKLVLELSNKTIFTNDNPRDEEPNQIINDLLKEKTNNNYNLGDLYPLLPRSFVPMSNHRLPKLTFVDSSL